MDYEKKYKEALERAKVIYQGNYKPDTAATIAKTLQNVFPDLKESEDERIRKHLISLVKNWDKDGIASKYTSNHNDIKQILAWLEKQGEQKPIINVPPREVILAIWDLGNEWKELTNGSISTEYGTQLDYIQKHWHKSEYYLREKQGGQKPTDKDMVEALRTEYEKGRADVIADTISWLENCWPRYCSNQTIIKGFKEAIKGE